jgi:hypothetical protein
MRAVIVAAIVSGVCGPAFAQQGVLERRIQADTPAAAVVWAPDGVANGMFAWRIAQTAAAPVIFEAWPLHYRDPSIVAERIDLAGHTVREALDLLVAQDPQYRWEERDGVIIIRPAALSSNPDDALNQPIAAVRADHVRAQDVLVGVMAAITGVSMDVQGTGDARRFSLDVPSGTVLDLLAATARAHGTMMWSVPDGARAPGQEGFSLGFKTFAGGGAGLIAPVAR